MTKLKQINWPDSAYGSDLRRAQVALDAEGVAASLKAMREPVDDELVRLMLEHNFCCGHCAQLTIRVCRALSAYALAQQPPQSGSPNVKLN